MTKFHFAPPYELPQWPAAPRPALADRHGETQIELHDIVIVGAGLAGLTLACDLAQRGVRAVVLDEDDTVGVRGASSRGICYAQKSLEIFERLGIFERIRAKGVSWAVGNTFSGEHRVWSFNLQSNSVSREPPFINLQQFYLEWFLVDRIMELGHVELRWKHQFQTLTQHSDHVQLEVQTPQGPYSLRARHLVDATGVNSPIRTQLGLDAHASRSADRWCITDVRFKKPLPQERWTWIDAPFNDGRSVWQHPMADEVWRMDYQMGEDADADEVSKPEVASARLSAQLGAEVELEFVWIGPYLYRDHLLDEMRHGRVFFIGDAAHVVCPFGARGGNSGIQDANNLGWKLAWVQRGWADAALLDSFQAERHAAAAENLKVTRRTARFLAPRTPLEHQMRRAVVDLAREHTFARSLVNAGRMSVANEYPPHAAAPHGAVTVQNIALQWGQRSGRAGHVGETSVVQLLRDADSRALRLCFGDDVPRSDSAHEWTMSVSAIDGPEVDLVDIDGALAAHLGVTAGADPGASVLIRPDAYRSR